MKKALIAGLMMLAGIASAQDFTQKNYICQENTNHPYIFNFSKDFLKFSRKFLGVTNVESFNFSNKLTTGNYIFSNATAEVLLTFSESSNDYFSIIEKQFSNTSAKYTTNCRAL